MPEGPEIRRAADLVEDTIKSGQSVRVEFGLDGLKHWESFLSNTQVLCVETHGKAMLTRFDNGLNIYSHNQLYGRWVCCPTGEAPETKRQLRLAIHSNEKSALLYSASDITVLQDDEIALHPFLSKLGPDVLDASVAAQQVVELLLSKRFFKRQLGGFLTDQSFVAGLGNYLRCEVLFQAGLNPKSKPVNLSQLQIKDLAKAVLDLPRQSYNTGGITNDLERSEKLMKQGASFEQARFMVFRRENLPCYCCGSTILRNNQGGQASYFCPHCQK